MTKVRTYVDANVLIAAWNAEKEPRAWARAVLDDPQRRFIISDFVRLEVLPKPEFHRKTRELAFMHMVFSTAENVPVSTALVQRALAMAGRYDLSPLDALHLAAAAEARVDELVTMERPEKPMCRQTEVRVISLRVLDEQGKA
ncbi:putative nucleic acid-binding protein, contains PIN domain [Thiorhodovibrio winogradskyi]|uniref:Nucleic acid-binding protein, contains PIN domain n=1 Tax=Thiorhodovibrio winogradskyi TaxID=77007 RepID=A0ABZ0SAZ9_9GAMM|nr:PIN domain-containing protein [Thiorhodovibrio winogradskyi]